jgi:hypothetical protein
MIFEDRWGEPLAKVGLNESALLVGEWETRLCEGSQSLGIDYVR